MRPRACERGPTHMHTLPPPRTPLPCLIYTDTIGPRHAAFTLDNAEGRDGCFWFPTRGRHLNGRRLYNSPGFASFKDPQPSPPYRPLVSLQMKWTNAKSMFLVSLITVFIPPLSLFPGRLRGYWWPWLSAIKVFPSPANVLWVFVHPHADQETRLNGNNLRRCGNPSVLHLFCINAAGFSQTISPCARSSRRRRWNPDPIGGLNEFPQTIAL